MAYTFRNVDQAVVKKQTFAVVKNNHNFITALWNCVIKTAFNCGRRT
jgi:hypothetical protein